MDDKKSKNFGINPFDDDTNVPKSKHFSDDDGPDEDSSSKKNEKKQKSSRFLDEDLTEDQAEVKHKTKKKIKGYKNDVKEYVSKVASKGQRSEFKDALGEEGVYADSDLGVKKKRKRKRRKKTVEVKEVKEKSGDESFVEAVPEPESSPVFEEVQPQEPQPEEPQSEEAKLEEPKLQEPQLEEPNVASQTTDEPVPESFIEPKEEDAQVIPVENVEEAVQNGPGEFAEDVVQNVPVESMDEAFNPFGDGVADSYVEEKKDEVAPVNPFAEAPKQDFEEPKWRDFEENEIDDIPATQVPEESTQVFTPEIVETKTVQEEPKNVYTEPEVSVPKTDAVKNIEPSVEDDRYDEGIFHMLEQAGITKGKIFGVFAAFVVVVLGIVGVFYLPFGDIFEGFKKTASVTETQKKEEKSVVKKEAVPEKDVVPEVKDGIEALNMSEILGNEYDYLVLGNDKILGVFFSLRLGGEFVSSEHRFSYYMRHLNEMQNLYATDIYKLLDQSYDRRGTLNDFLNEMKVSIDNAKRIYNEVVKAAANLNAASLSASEQRDLFETEFFTDIKDLRGQDSFTNLEKFVGFSQNAIRLRAYYKAYNYISEMYLNSLKKIEPRYKDISVNFDALVKGVHVFDVPGSEINAIIRLSQ